MNVKTLSALTLIAAFLPTPALAEDGKSVLEKMERAVKRYKDMVANFDVVDHEGGRADRKLAIEIKLKGDKRFTRFTAPADLKGTRVLVVSQTQMYIYLPAYKKVRRIASHVTSQGFMGTVFSSDDLALNTYTDKYTAKLVGTTDESFKLDCAAIAGGDAPYPRFEVDVRKKDFLPLEFRFFDDKGKHIKTEKREGYACKNDNICLAATQTMHDHRTPDRWSQLVRKEWKVNTGVSNRVFSKRNLARGR